MRILFAGSTGMIGKEIGKRLIENGHEIVALVRNTDSARQALPFPAKLVKWSADDEVPASAMKGIDAILNLSGASIADGRWTEARKKEIIDSRVESTRSLVNAALKNQKTVKIFVNGSAVGFYGNRGDETLDESSSKGKGFLPDVVEMWENELRPLESTSIRQVAVRTAVVLARHGGAMDKLLPLFEKGVAGNLGSGQQWMSWIHIDDIARLFVFALETETVVGPINGCAPEPVRNDRFTIELARALGKSVFLPVPEVALKIALGEMASSVLDSQRALPSKTQQLGFTFEHGGITETLQTIAEPLKGGQHEMLSEQWVPLKPDALFPYFRDEKNLESLTPPFLKFLVKGKSTDEIGEGTLIDYTLSLHGLPFNWRTRIESWKPSSSFVDTQLSGPYKKWHHTHDFIPFGGGTLVRDRVIYKLPMGMFGEMVAGWKVNGDVQKIFDYRREVIDQKFGNRPEHA